MLELLKEVLSRNWDCTIQEGKIYLVLGNREYEITNDEKALKVLDEINIYWR